MYTDNCYSLFDFKNTLYVFNSISSCEGLSPIHLDKLDNIDYIALQKNSVNYFFIVYHRISKV